MDREDDPQQVDGRVIGVFARANSISRSVCLIGSAALPHVIASRPRISSREGTPSIRDPLHRTPGHWVPSSA